MKFPDLFLTFSWPSPNFYWLFAVQKHDILTFSGIHMGHTDGKNIVAIIWHKIIMICHFYVPNQLNHGLIYKMSKNYRKCFLIFLYFFLAIARLGNHIMTLTVKIWNEAFILISIPFFLTFSWLFDEFQHFLTPMKISWLFKIFTFSWLFPDLWQPCISMG